MNPELLKNEVRSLLDMMGIPIKDISIILDKDLHLTIISLRVSGTEQELFEASHNELSRDFGLILALLLKKKHHYFKDIVVDINGVNKGFIDMAKSKAKIALERVQFFDKPYEFGYLNSYERMLIHSYLKKVPGITTVSEGEGGDRRLYVKKEQ